MTTLQYTPPPTVKQFIRHYRNHELFMDWIVGPVGSGKTTGIFFKLIYMAGLQERSPRDGIRRSSCVVVRSTASQLADTTIKSFNYWFKDGVAGKWHATIKNFVLRFGDVECEVMFRPLDTPDDIDRVLSLEVTFAIIDEIVQIPREIVEALSARCGRYPPEIEGGATNWGMWGASNPGQEADWWYPMLEDHELLEPGQEPENWEYYKQPSGFSPDAENLNNLPGKADYYHNLAKGKTAHWVKQYIEVEWGYSMSGKPVFPMFNRDMHVAKTHLVPNRGYELVIGYDPGLSGSGVTLAQYDDSIGQLRVFDEFALTDYATDRMIAEKLKPLLRRKYEGFEVVMVPDPASSSRSQAVANSAVLDVLKKHFKVKGDADNTIESRLSPAQYYMMRLVSGGPALLIDPRCIRLIRALVSGYKYTVVKKTEDVRDKPDKNGHSHIADSFTYVCRYVRKGEESAGKRRDPPRKLQGKRVNSYAMQ
jgi:hypothetical protein